MRPQRPLCATKLRDWCMDTKLGALYRTKSPAAAAKEVGMGNPAEERPPPSVISVPKLVLVVNRVVCRLM